MASNMTIAQLDALCDTFGYIAEIDGDTMLATIRLGNTILYAVELI